MKAMMTVLAALLASAAALAADVTPGQPAPDFVLLDTQEQPHKPSDYRGRYVVLEWTNFDCPFVRKHYDSGNMQRLQKKYGEVGVIWLTINSSAPGKPGNYSAQAWDAMVQMKGAQPTAVLLDPTGEVGRLYGAKATPHLFVIDPLGRLLYMGAIDDKPTTDVRDIEGARNYLEEALDTAMTGRPVAIAVTAAYGCSVKY
jgi:hypothetical protein